jgi:hypothetical protein
LIIASGFPLMVAACSDAGDDVYERAQLGSSEQALISDQLHQNGTTGFFFLPPFVPRPGPFGDFVSNAAPTVRVDRINPSSGQVLASVATYTRTSGPGAETVRLHPRNAPGEDGDLDPEGYFVVRFRTAQFNLSPDASYRVTVSVQNRTLGFADLDVGRTLRELTSVDREQFVPVLNGQVLRIKFRIDRPAVDADADGVLDWNDNCPTVANANQRDTVRNGIGDACRCQTVSCAPLDACHVAGSCSPTTGLCSASPNAPNGTACNDGDACTTNDRCTNGVCSGQGGQCCDPSELSGSGSFPGMSGDLSFDFPPLAAQALSRLATVPNPSRHAVYFTTRLAMNPGQIAVGRTPLWGLTVQYGLGTTYAQILPLLNDWLASNVLPAGAPAAATLEAPADAAFAPRFSFAELQLSACGAPQSFVVLEPEGGSEIPLIPE